jgi:hypothetical protein
MINIKDTIAKEKIELLDLAKALGSVKDACRLTGYSRSSYYSFKHLYETGGEKSLRRVRRKASIPPYIQKAVLKEAINSPEFGRRLITFNLRKRGVIVTQSRVRTILIRNDLVTLENK